MELWRRIAEDASICVIPLEALAAHASRSILLCRWLPFYNFAALVLWG